MRRKGFPETSLLVLFCVSCLGMHPGALPPRPPDPRPSSPHVARSRGIPVPPPPREWPSRPVSAPPLDVSDDFEWKVISLREFEQLESIPLHIDVTLKNDHLYVPKMPDFMEHNMSLDFEVVRLGNHGANAAKTSYHPLGMLSSYSSGNMAEHPLRGYSNTVLPNQFYDMTIPGDYRITMVISFLDTLTGRDCVIRSPPVTIEVTPYRYR